MKLLLNKEFKLAMHPTCLIFLALSTLVLVPNYPYYTASFYMTLAIFFTCLSGRENKDILYMMLLPLRKRDIVRARFGFAVLLELAQLAIAVPFAFLRQKMPLPGNEVGMDANIAFFGLSLVLLGIFNLAFFVPYYKNPEQVGTTFAKTSVLFFAVMLLMEALTHIVPFMRDVLDTKDPLHLTAKLAVLAAGAAVFVLLTMLSYRKSVRVFEAIDL